MRRLPRSPRRAVLSVLRVGWPSCELGLRPPAGQSLGYTPTGLAIARFTTSKHQNTEEYALDLHMLLLLEAVLELFVHIGRAALTCVCL